MTINKDFCRYLKWDSDFFGKRIAKITANQLTPEKYCSIKDWCQDNQIDCLFFLVDTSDSQSIRLAEDNNFRFVEVRVTLEMLLKNRGLIPDRWIKPEIQIRPAKSSDREALVDMSKNSYTNSRWYFDPCFDKEKCDAYYQTWVSKSLDGYADYILVAEKNGEVLGYLSGNHFQRAKPATYGLLAVHEKARGLGIGPALAYYGLDYHNNLGAKKILAVTQGRNIVLSRLLMKVGFILKDVQIYYHKWFSNCDTP
ncbi:MAG: GNAT family N-acetyltransferase [Anaerolineales bacterium]|jgi:RimJ/RimL family protein N-acetyltransferase